MSKSLFPDLSPKLAERGSWLVNGGIEDTHYSLKEMTGTEDDLAILRGAIAYEESHGKRTSRLKPIKAALAKWEKKLPIVDKTTILAGASATIEKHRQVLQKHAETFASATLGPCLQIGLACLKANDAHAIRDAGKKGQGRKGKNQVTRDEISTPGGFEGWLAEECPWLKKPTAYKYMTAVKGLQLDHTATEAQVAAALKRFLKAGPVTLKALCDAAVEAVKPPELSALPVEQQEFDFLKTHLTHFREQSEQLLALKDQLKAMPDFNRAASARVYSILHELTGTHWRPSDEPDELAGVDPDSISLS